MANFDMNTATNVKLVTQLEICQPVAARASGWCQDPGDSGNKYRLQMECNLRWLGQLRIEGKDK